MRPHPYLAEFSRVATTRRFPVLPPTFSGAGQVAARVPTVSQDARAAIHDVRACGGALEITMSDDLALTPRLGAASAGLDQAEFVRRAIVQKAAGEGLPSLADCVGGAAEARQSHKLEVAGSNPAPATNPEAKASEDNGAYPAHVGHGAAGDASRLAVGRTTAAADRKDSQGQGFPSRRSAFIGVDLARGGDALAVARRDEAGAFVLITTDAGDLIETPPFERLAPNRFASGP